MGDFITMGISPIRLDQLPHIFFDDSIINIQGTARVEVPSVCKSDFKVYGREKKGVTPILKKKYTPFSFLPSFHLHILTEMIKRLVQELLEISMPIVSMERAE